RMSDRFRAKERRGEVGKVIYGDRPEGQAWIDARCEELDKGHLKSLVHALRSHIGQHKEARECIQYIWRNRRRMRYPQFEKQGFCTSTGVVESGCKIVVGTRLKRAGMQDRKSTRLNSSHEWISYAVFCLKKKT